MIKKLKNKKGLTLSEVLVSVLILGILGTAISIGIATGVKVYAQSMEFSESNYLASIIVQKISDEIRNGENFPSDANVSFDSEDFGDNVTFTLDANGYIKLGSELILSEKLYTNDVKVKDLVLTNIPDKEQVKLSFKIVDAKDTLEVEIGESYDFHIGYLN